MTTARRLLTALPADHRQRLMDLAQEVSFAQDSRIFEEGGPADRLWVIRSGTVALDLQVPDRRRVTVETLQPGDLLGWSWLFPPHQWEFGAEAFSPVRAYEFDAAKVRSLCEEESALGLVLLRTIAEILAHRLEGARTRLIENYAKHGGATL
ncbi:MULTISPECIES: cyclic nucleotide-binding domain-containing protein [unclassified Streptomyces]|uniref:cyclic nucleotide-binding domain-containing protein n=1 Tax=Streptomyces sp. NPDC005955 TaxID=3364738 RepID=UPI00369C6F80